MEDASGRRATWGREPPSTSRFHALRRGEMDELGKILLVEDDPNDAELTVMALTDNHLANEIVIARDGEEALDFLYRRGAYESRKDGNPIVVLLDLKLPKVDGLEVLQQVKFDPDLRTIPVVMLTSSREDRDLI